MKYFKYSFITNIKPMLFILLIGSLIYPLFILVTEVNESTTTQVGILITYLGVLSYIIPFFNNHYLMRKRTIDYYYSLPIKRKTLNLINLIIGYLIILIPYTILYLLGVLIVHFKSNNFLLIHYLPLYFITVFISCCIYVIVSFIITRANTKTTAIVLVFLYTFLIPFVLDFLNIASFYEGISFFCLFSGLIISGNNYSGMITGRVVTFDHFFYYSTCLYAFLAIICFILLIILLTKDDVSKKEGVTDSWFGFKVLIPLYHCIICSLISNNLSILVLGIFGYVACTFGYKRSLVITKYDLIGYAISTSCVIIYQIIMIVGGF